VYSRNAAHRAAFCAEMQPHTRARLRAVDEPRAALAGADLVVCATGSNAPVFDGAWLEPGQHVTSIVGSNHELVREGLLSAKRGEVDDVTVQRPDLTGATLRAQAIQGAQGDLADPVAAGLIRWEDVHDLAAIVAGEAPRRTSREQITLF